MKHVLFIFILIFGCTEQSDIEVSSSISFSNIATTISPTVCGDDEPTRIIEVNGTGMGLLDMENDGDLDLFVANASDAPCRLYENISIDTIDYKDVTEDFGIDVRRWANGVAVGDANGDGFDDIYITCYGPNILLMNNEGKSFVNATFTAGVGDDRWGTGARFGDLDGDGDLDLYVCNYVEFDASNPPPRAQYKGQSVLGGPHGMTPESDIVYENLGDGTFQDVTSAWGFNQSPAFSMNATILDFNGDGLQDVYVGNDSMGNYLFINTGETPTRFVNKGMQTGIASNGDGAMQATMGIAIADVNGNGRPDVFTTNFSSDTNTLHTNDKSGYFDDRTKRFGLGLVSRSSLGWTCGFHDFDLDGDEDLFIVNGHVYPEATKQTMDSEREQAVLLFERTGDRFVNIPQEELFRDRSAVFGDLDRDGDIDVIIAQRNGEVRILRNNADIALPLFISLKGKDSNKKALGASIRLTFTDGTRATRWFTDGSGFQSSHAPLQYVVPNEKTVVRIEITWPNGDKQVVLDIPNDGLFVIEQPSYLQK